MLEKYVVLSVDHFQTGQGGTISVDDIDTLEVRDEDNKPLTLVPRTELLPSEAGMLSAIEAAIRQSAGRIGAATRFFIFDAGSVRACEKVKSRFHSLAKPTFGKHHFLVVHSNWLSERNSGPVWV
jgi:hypothetical protein